MTRVVEVKPGIEMRVRGLRWDVRMSSELIVRCGSLLTTTESCGGRRNGYVCAG